MALVRLLGYGSTANAAEFPEWQKRCEAANVSLLFKGEDPGGNSFSMTSSYSMPPIVAIGTAIAPDRRPGPGRRGMKVALIVASGPTVDMSYWEPIETEITCTNSGIVLLATLTFDDIPLLDNALWRPEVELVAAPLRPNLRFDVKWQVRLGKNTEGKSIQDFPELRKYPITISKTIE